MNLKEYLSTTGSSVALAIKIGVTPVIISQWKTGVRPVPIRRCLAIERTTNGAVTRRDLRPDDWESIWPELAEKVAANA
jgi:DNA-binding transcriptional regulator YdaS (Cro superfamily)